MSFMALFANSNTVLLLVSGCSLIIFRNIPCSISWYLPPTPMALEIHTGATYITNPAFALSSANLENVKTDPLRI